MEQNNLNFFNQLHLGDIVGDTKRIVIAYTKLTEYIPNDTYATWIAICMKDNQYHPYVVWKIAASSKGFTAESGDYCFTIEEAVDLYKKRGGNVKSNPQSN